VHYVSKYCTIAFHIVCTSFYYKSFKKYKKNRIDADGFRSINLLSRQEVVCREGRENTTRRSGFYVETPTKTGEKPRPAVMTGE
jgi:hypothetical protein